MIFLYALFSIGAATAVCPTGFVVNPLNVHMCCHELKTGLEFYSADSCDTRHMTGFAHIGIVDLTSNSKQLEPLLECLKQYKHDCFTSHSENKHGYLRESRSESGDSRGHESRGYDSDKHDKCFDVAIREVYELLLISEDCTPIEWTGSRSSHDTGSRSSNDTGSRSPDPLALSVRKCGILETIDDIRHRLDTANKALFALEYKCNVHVRNSNDQYVICPKSSSMQQYLDNTCEFMPNCELQRHYPEYIKCGCEMDYTRFTNKTHYMCTQWVNQALVCDGILGEHAECFCRDKLQEGCVCPKSYYVCEDKCSKEMCSMKEYVSIAIISLITTLFIIIKFVLATALDVLDIVGMLPVYLFRALRFAVLSPLEALWHVVMLPVRLLKWLIMFPVRLVKRLIMLPVRLIEWLLVQLVLIPLGIVSWMLSLPIRLVEWLLFPVVVKIFNMCGYTCAWNCFSRAKTVQRQTYGPESGRLQSVSDVQSAPSSRD